MRRQLAVVVLLALTSAGCGDDDSGELSKDEYVAQGDALCRSFMEEADALGEPTSIEELVTMLDAVIELADEVFVEFSALEPPADGESVQEALLTALSDSTDKIREARDHAADGDQDGFTAAVTEAVEIGRTSDEPAKAYGFQVCGSEEELRNL